MGWGLFRYYPYWFVITLLTFPAAYICWFVKKNEWYSGVILSFVTVFLAIVGVNRFHALLESPRNHLVTIIYCFAMILLFIFALLKNKKPRIIAAAITAVALLVCIPFTWEKPFETYNNAFIEENEITFIGEPYVSFWSGEGKGNVEIIKYDGGYNFKLSGLIGKTYQFTISDDEQEYHFKYYYNTESDTIMVEKTE